MIGKKFSGFTKDQMESIARHLGHEGPLESFNEYLASSPEMSAKLSRLTEKARGFVEAPDMAAGGTVTGRKVGDTIKDTRGNILTWDGKSWRTATGVDRYNASNPKTPIKRPAAAPPSKLPAKAPAKPPAKPAAPAKPLTPAQKTAAAKATATAKASPSTKLAANAPTAVTTPVKPVGISQNLQTQRNAGQVISDTGNVASAMPPVATTTATPGQAAPASVAATPKATEANTVDPALVGDEVNQVVDETQAAQGTLSAGSKVTAAQALPSANATVQGQLTNLMAQFEGGETPAWAAGAKRMADTAMMQRGLGASSMAASATTQAMMESALSIAVQDAQTFSAFEMQNLNNRQQARLVNAQSFLQMDLANLNNEQQTEMFKAQARIQGLFTDQAATNAAAQFNATSQNQTDQFFAELKTQVATFNAAQKNALNMFNAEQKSTTSMFNAGQLNAIKMFNTEQRNAISKFNAQQRLVIDQANAKWRQEIATTNNANINEANRINAQNATNLTTAAYNNIWQTERDLMAYAFTAAENANQRAAELTLAKLNANNYKDYAEAQQKNALGQAAGGLIANTIDRILDSVF